MSSYRKNSMMAMLDAKPEEKGSQGYWNDESDQLSPIRKHLISTYLQVPDEEAMPLLGEYFGVALSFVALGALVRASNSTKKRQKKANEEERLDLRSCSRFQRMALESMLKESMERLRNLSQNAYQLEERVRNLVDENVAQDKERVQLLNRVADSEKSVQELRALRRAEGRANERVMCIVAAKEQDWLKEKRSLQKEVEKLKETVTGMTREAKFQARRCRNPTCEHCKGIDRVVRNSSKGGRISLRELHSLRDSQLLSKRELPKMDKQPVAPKVDRQQEDGDDRLLSKAIEHKKKQPEQAGQPKNQSKTKFMELSESLNTWRAQSGGSASGSGQSSTKEILVKQQQDMESELANILKRVGMLKQRSYSSAGPPARKEGSSAKEMQLVDGMKAGVELPKDEFDVVLQLTKEQAEESTAPEPSVHSPTLEVAEHSFNQEDYFSVKGEEDRNLVNLKAFQGMDGHEVSISQEGNHLVSDDRRENVEIRPELGNSVEAITSRDSGITIVTREQQQLLDEDAEFAAFERSLDSGEELGLAEFKSEEHLESKTMSPVEVETSAASDQHDESHEGAGLDKVFEGLESKNEISLADNLAGSDSASGEATELQGEPEIASSIQDHEDLNVQEQGLRPKTITDDLCNAGDGGGLQFSAGCSQEEIVKDAGVAKNPASSSAGDEGHSTHEVSDCNENEQLVGVEHENRTEPNDAVSIPLDPVTGVMADHTDPFAMVVSEQPHRVPTDFDSGLDVQENWEFEDSALSTGEGLLENQDIPLFERNNVDDSAGELPEPEEKRVCGPEILDSCAAGTSDEASSTPEQMRSIQEEGKNSIDKNRVTTEEGVEREQNVDLFADEDGMVSNEKSNLDKAKEHVRNPELADIVPVLES